VRVVPRQVTETELLDAALSPPRDEGSELMGRFLVRDLTRLVQYCFPTMLNNLRRDRIITLTSLGETALAKYRSLCGHDVDRPLTLETFRRLGLALWRYRGPWRLQGQEL
jgi:hypothetical protein